MGKSALQFYRLAGSENDILSWHVYFVPFIFLFSFSPFQAPSNNRVMTLTAHSDNLKKDQPFEM
jgi:hypothetical protein